MRTLESVDDQGGSITIAAIDNGLAFPFKHPDEWRACKLFSRTSLSLSLTILATSFIDPFYWAWLPLAQEPFSETVCYLVLDKLKSQQFVQSLVDDLRVVFSVSCKTDCHN